MKGIFTIKEEIDMMEGRRKKGTILVVDDDEFQL